ncbi:Type II secretion system protein M [Bienertia sinuspersici]
MEKLDAMVKVATERNNKEMELMSLEAQTLVESSHTVADSLAKLVSMPGLVPGSPEFFFACTMIEYPQKRILLNGMPDDNTRLQWIKYLFEKNG